MSFMLWVRHFSGRIFDRTGRWLGAGLFALIMITGHLGGSLTHGEDYLSGALRSAEAAPAVIRPIANVQEAAVYDSVVKPILEVSCYKCHGPSKQKGGLRLDSPEGIAKGGKDGTVLVAGKGDSSELVRVLLLPLGDDHHMPPRGQRQVSRDQQALLSWWIDQGADYHKKVKELVQPEKVHGALTGLQGGVRAGEAEMLVPAEEVSPADEKDMKSLRDAGVVVMPLAQGSNYLSVSFVGVSAPASRLVSLLLPLKKQMVQLDLSGTDVRDGNMEVVRQCAALRVLNLSNTPITDNGIGGLGALKELRVLNLVGTAVTAPGLMAMQPPAHLHALYLYHTKVEARYWAQLKGLFRGAVLDSGGYKLERLESDTAVVRGMPAKK